MILCAKKWNPSRRRVCLVPFIAMGLTVDAFPLATSFQSDTTGSGASCMTSTSTSKSLGPNRSRMTKSQPSMHRSKTVSCQLFFQKTDCKPAPRRMPLKPGILENLQSAAISLPFEVLFDHVDAREEALTIRFMTPNDLNFMLPMCISEFGTGPTADLSEFPFQDLKGIPSWWDRVYFEPYIALALRAKMNANVATTVGSTMEDPAVLVLSRRAPDQTEVVVGMVELSSQPPEANRNPPAFPVPLGLKKLYCQMTGQTIQGWVTNLLIDPMYRGLGYSKMLMAATEGIAKLWGRDCIYLHVDADVQSGKVPQRLYEGMGYEVVTDDTSDLSWMGEGFNPFSSVQIIEGVPLLCLCKRL